MPDVRDDEYELIHVYAGRSSDHSVVREELPARLVTPGVYELLASPGLVLNLAKGDFIRLDDPDGPAVVVERGGNYCIQIYGEMIPAADIDRLAEDIATTLGGSLDGRHGGALALTVPSRMGGRKIRSVFDDFTARTGIAWYYANIYRNPEDTNDETLLDWWGSRSNGPFAG